MWSLNASRCFHASATWWKLPNANGFAVTSAWSDFVGARSSQMTGATKKTANASEDREPRAEAEHAEPHQSSARKRPVRVTTRTAATSPIASRSTAMAAAPLKSAYRKASW